MILVTNETKGYGTAILSAVILATTGICIRYLTEVHSMDALVLAFWRNIIIAVVLIFILECAYPVLVEIKKADLSTLLMNGIILSIFNYFWTTSVAINGAATATFLVYSSVPFTAIFGKIILKEHLGPGKIIAVMTALIGCLFVSGIAQSKPLHYTGYGPLLGLISGLCFAAYSLSGKYARRKGLSSWTIILYSFSFAALFLFMAKCITAAATNEISKLIPDFLSLGASIPGWTVLIILAIGPTLLGFGLYNISLGYLQTAVVNLIAIMEPPITAVLAFLLLGERLTGYQLCGSFLIVLAIVLLKTKNAKQKSSPGIQPGHDFQTLDSPG